MVTSRLIKFGHEKFLRAAEKIILGMHGEFGNLFGVHSTFVSGVSDFVRIIVSMLPEIG